MYAVVQLDSYDVLKGTALEGETEKVDLLVHSLSLLILLCFGGRQLMVLSYLFVGMNYYSSWR